MESFFWGGGWKKNEFSVAKVSDGGGCRAKSYQISEKYFYFG